MHTKPVRIAHFARVHVHVRARLRAAVCARAEPDALQVRSPAPGEPLGPAARASKQPAATPAEANIDFISHELKRVFETGRISTERYSRSILFEDPITRYTNVEGYSFNIGLLVTVFQCNMTVHDVVATSDTQIQARWTLELSFKLLPLPGWKPGAQFTGVATYDVDPVSGLITKHVDTWDMISDNSFLSLEGLRYVLDSFTTVRLTPELETPDYSLLFKTATYEIRRYSSYVVAEAPMGSTAGPASGAGFETLAGYIFGNNSTSESMEMTTPVFTSGDDGTRRMGFVMSGDTPVENLPAPKAQDVSVREQAGGVYAALTFSGLPFDHEVVEAEQKLRSQLIQDGVQPQAGYTLARYNEPFVLPFLRRNEVLIPVTHFTFPGMP